MKRLLGFLIVLLAVAQQASAAGTVTLTAQATYGVGDVLRYRYAFAWTSDAAGAVSGNAQILQPGRIIQVEYTPDGGGTQPTDLYDATLVYSNSLDLLQGSGANLSNTTTYGPVFQALYFHDATRTVDLVIANAGNAKGGTILIWVGP